MARPALSVLEVFEPTAGGVPEHVRVLARGLAARGLDVHVAGPEDAAPRADIEAAGVPFHPLPIVGDMLLLRRDLPTLRQLVSLLRAGRYDVVHAHAQKAGLLVRLAAPPLRVPDVYTPHSLIYRHQFDRPLAGARSRYLKTLWMERALGLVTSTLVAVSEEERAAAVADRLVSARRAVLVRSGVELDLEAFAPDPELAAFRGDGPLLGLVSALRDQKGLPTLLDALELLVARGTPVRFAIAGSGPLEEEVRTRVAQGPLAPTTVVVPYRGRVEPYLLALDAFVLPSYWEGLPIAVLEAMAAGLPVIASDVGGTAEAVTEGGTGWLVPHSDVEALAGRLKAMASDPEARARMGAAGRARAESDFGVDRMVGEMAALYARLARS